MSKASDSTVQATLGDLPTAEPDTQAETDTQSDDREETTVAPDLETIADDVGTTTTHQRERGDRRVEADDHGGAEQEELRVRSETVAGRSAGYHRRGLK